MGRFSLAGWMLGDEVSDGGRAAYVQTVKLANASGVALGTVGNPLVTSGGGGSGGVAQGTATVAAPTYVEGSNNALSQDLTGALRVTGTLTAGGLAQGSDTAGQQGGMSMGAATTAAPTYTTAKTYPLSLTTVGALRVDGSGATQPVSGTITANAGSGTFAISAASLPLPTGAATSALQTTGNAALTTINTTLGSPIQTTGGTVGLVAGTALVGKVGIDQTTPGTTNGTSVAQIGANAVLTGNGVTGTGSQRVTIASDNTAFGVIATGNVASAATDSGNPVKAGAVFLTTPPTVTTGQRVDLQANARGSLSVMLAAGDGNIAGFSGTTSDGQSSTNAITVKTFGFTYNGTSWDRTAKANATSRIISSAASTNATSGKASAGNIFMMTGRNANAAVLYLKIYNKASAPTVGTDTPVMTVALPPQSNFVFDWANGRYFATGIAYAFTTGSSDADTGAVAAGDILGFNLDYS